MMEPRDLSQLRMAYEARFRKDDLRDSDSFYRWVLRKLRVQTGRALLDVACGSGRLLNHARRAGLQTMGLDFSVEALKLARAFEPEARLILADAQHLPLPDSSVDYLANLGSLEHFVSPQRGVREMVRVLRPEGTSAILLPNAFYAVDLIWWVWRKGRASSHRQPLERFAAYQDWRQLLEENGLRVCTAHKYNFMFPRSRLDWQYYRRFPRKLLNLAVAPLIPFNFSFSFLYVCRREVQDE